MQRFSLTAHPDFPPLAVDGVTADLGNDAGGLRLTYRVQGTTKLVLPRTASSGRADDLWRTTCFELFLLFDDDERYVEFNFSPSTRWAAYAFDGHREGRTDLALAAPPRIERLGDGIDVRCDLRDLPHGELRMGLNAVIEEEGGVLSYWALAHPPGGPDFHHAACFAARLPAPARP